MFDIKLRLISMLGFLTFVVVVCLVLDYFRLTKHPYKLGTRLAIFGILVGVFLTLNAVLPNSDVYGRVFSKVDTPRKIVALTFDDGPYPPYTDQILDILAKKNVKATFFVIGKNVDKYPYLVQRMADENHEIGNHTYNHVDLLKYDKKAISDEIDRTSAAVKKITGIEPDIVRPPHGFRDPIVLEVLKSKGLKVIEWSVMSRDWTNPGTEIIVERTLSKVRSGSVILLHDGDGTRQREPRQQTTEAVRIIIDKLKTEGYSFVTINELLHEK